MYSFFVNYTFKNIDFFPQEPAAFEEMALRVFQMQYLHVPIYHEFVDTLKIDVAGVETLDQIPFLPIQFFKTHRVIDPALSVETTFESSGTSGITLSKHPIHSLKLYETSILNGFEKMYGAASDYVFLALLPHYLERQYSSLVYMVNFLMQQTNHEKYGFFLHDFTALTKTLRILEEKQSKVILFGVTFALLDFFEQLPFYLNHTTVIETGGMKGRRKEITKQEFHSMLSNKIDASRIHSEYGMTELLSPSYALKNGVFYPPNSKKILVRDPSDPLSVQPTGKGVLNIIDLANAYSCSFIATDDLGLVHSDGSFEVLGRMEQSDMRGCNLLYH